MSNSISISRPSQNTFSLEGVLAINGIKELTDDSKKKYLSGELTIKVSECNDIVVNVFSYEKTKAGADNKVYKSLMTIKNEYISLGEDAENASLIKINNGSLFINEYFVAQQDRWSVTPQLKTNFVNRVKDIRPSATFELEMIFQSESDEMVDDKETGRGIMKGYTVEYNGDYLPVTVIIEEEMWKEVSGVLVKNQTVQLNGDIKFKNSKNTTVKKVAFGKGNENTAQQSVRELIANGLTPLEEDDDQSYTKAEIKVALENRVAQVEAKKQKSLFGNKKVAKNKVVDKDKGFDWEKVG